MIKFLISLDFCLVNICAYRMTPFTKPEIKLTLVILVAIAFVTFQNLKISERRSRDFQRRDDLARIFEALHSFHSEFGFFPPSENGYIKACKGNDFDQEMAKNKDTSNQERLKVYLQNLRSCEWGKEPLSNLFDANYLPYLKSIPSDVAQNKGFSYHYISNGRVFQLYAHLEGGGLEIGFDKDILLRGLSCGKVVCNFGRSAFGKTPLNMSLEEYEAKLKEHPEFDSELEKRRVN